MAHDELDSLIDSALAGIASPEPPWGMEARILRRVRDAEARRHLLLWFWMPAGLLATAAMVLLFAPMPEIAPPPLFRVQIPVPAPATLAVQRHAVRKRLSVPHLSASEIALVEAVQSHPEETAAAFAELRAKSLASIEIAELFVNPIEIKGLREEIQ